MRFAICSAARCHPALLIWAAVALAATEHLFHYPIAVMTLIGTWRLVRAPVRTLRPLDARLVLLAFGFVWMPQLLALPDAADPSRALKTVLAYLHFLPCALFIVAAAREPGARRLIGAGVAAICAFFILDALVQLVAGRDFFGYPHDAAMLKGAFYPKQRLGLVLALLSPLYVRAMADLARRHWTAWLLALPLCAVILLSLKRTAWIMLAVAAAGGLWYALRIARIRPRVVLALVAAAVIGIAAAVAINTELRARVGVTTGVLGTDPAAFDRASSYRLSLWRTGAAMFRNHWLNGVGPRGYRSAYLEYAAEDDFWRARGGQTHPHLMLLEVLTETGLIGFAGYCLFLLLLCRALAREARSDAHAYAWLLAALIAAFPLNAHLAFYGSYWSSLMWLLVPVGLARPPRSIA